MRKPAFCICENKDADQPPGDREADQRLCFRYIDSTIPLFSKSEISSLKPFSVTEQTGLCVTWLETQKIGFVTSRLIFHEMFCLLAYNLPIAELPYPGVDTNIITSAVCSRLLIAVPVNGSTVIP